MCFKSWNRRNLFNKPQICILVRGVVGKKDNKTLKPQRLPWNVRATVLQPSSSPLTPRPLLLRYKEHSAPRCNSTWLSCSLHVCSKSFCFLFLVCPAWRHSDCVKDTIRATVGWLRWLNNAWNQQWPRGRLSKWVVGWGQGLVSICGDLTFLSMGSFRLMDQSIWMKYL